MLSSSQKSLFPLPFLSLCQVQAEAGYKQEGKERMNLSLLCDRNL